MTIKKRAVLGIAVLASAAAAAPAPSAQAWEQCYAVFTDGPDLCIGSSQCNSINDRLEKVTGQRWECLQ